MVNVAVIGAQYGDEGKGRMVDYYCRQLGKDAIVVRYNGGAQAGHTVTLPDGRRHVFHHYGSGSLNGNPTYWSEYALFEPLAFLAERKVLKDEFNIHPVFAASPYCRVVTPYDIIVNRIECSKNNRGTCGVGINETIRRSENPDLNLMLYHFRDNNVPIGTKILGDIRSDFLRRYGNINTAYLRDEDWKMYKALLDSSMHHSFVDVMINLVDDIYLTSDLSQFSDIVFEGAQGLMLDEYFGNFPYVTPSRTGSVNITNLCRKHNLELYETTYMVRPYISRHGVDNTFKPEDISQFFNVVDPTNIYNEWQKGTSYSFLNLNELNKFLLMDKPYNRSKYINIGISCIDHIKSLDNYVYIDNIDDIQELPCSSSFDSFKDVLSSRLLDVHHNFSNILEFSKPYN